MIEQVVTPVTHDLGAFKVRRSLPARERTMVGPFIFVDQFGPAQMVPGEGMDVRPHPHINLATVTYLFDGAIQHKDSLGNDQRIEPGAINLMTAGKGIVHSERSPDDTRRVGPSFYGMQTWLALPDGKEEIDPAFEHVPTESLPAKFFPRTLPDNYSGRPLYDLILDDAGRREIDELWRELDFISNAPARQLAGFVWFERTDSDFMLSPEFNHLRAEDQALASDEKFGELRRLYEAKLAKSAVSAEV